MERIHQLLVKTYVGVVKLGVDRNAAFNLVRELGYTGQQADLNNKVDKDMGEIPWRKGHARRKLNDKQMEELQKWTLDRKEKQGKWRIGDVEDWVLQRWGVRVSRKTIYRYLKALDVPPRLSIQVESSQPPPPQVMEPPEAKIQRRKLDNDKIHELQGWVTQMTKLHGYCPSTETEAWVFGKWGIEVSWSTMRTYLKDLEDGKFKPPSNHAAPKLTRKQLEEVQRVILEEKNGFRWGKKAEMFVYEKWGIDMTSDAIRRHLARAGMHISFNNVNDK